MLELSDEKLSALLLERKLASVAQLLECRAIQEKMRELGVVPKTFREVLLEKGILSAAQLEALTGAASTAPAVTQAMNAMTRGPAQVGSGVASAEFVKPKADGMIQIPGYTGFSKLGQGGMGMVFKARQTSMDRLVAIKVLPRRFAKDPMFVDRFYREAKASAKLNHENIIQGIDVGQTEGIHYFVMEFVEGEPVSKKLKERGKLEESEAVDIAWQMTKALDHAHRGQLVHRDVKPENILVTKDGVAKLCDLGLAKDIGSDSSLTQAGTSVGTPHYIAPEQARGEPNVDIRADVYALGASLYHMLTGQVPFDGPTATVVMTKHVTEELVPPIKVNPEISAGANAVVMKAMAKPREGRYQTPAEMQEDLEALMRGAGPVHAKLKGRTMTGAKSSPSSSSLRAVRPAQRHAAPQSTGALVGMGLVGLVAIAGLVGFLLASKGPSGDGGRNTASVNGSGGGPTNLAPSNHGPAPTNTVHVPPDETAARAAAAELEEIAAFEKACLADMRDFNDVRLKYEDFLSEHKDQEIARRAQIQRDRFEEMVQERAEEWVKEAERKFQSAMDAGRYEDAVDAAGDVPAVLNNTRAVTRLEEAGVRARQAQDEAYRKALDEADAKLKAEDFEGAIAALDRIAEFGSAGMKKTALERRTGAEDKRRAIEQERARGSEKLYREKYGPEIVRLLESKKLSQYPVALQRCRELMAGELKWQAAVMEREVLIDATMLAALRDDVLAGINALHLRGVAVTLEGLKSKEAVKFYPGTASEWEFKGTASPVQVALNLDILTPADVQKLVMESPAYKAGGPDVAMKLGLFEWYSLHSADAEKWFKNAQKQYAEAKAEASAARAKFFLDQIASLAVASQKEREAQERFKRGEQAFKDKQWQEAQSQLAPLVDPTNPAGFAALTWVKDRSTQIADMLKRCAQELAGKQAVAGLFAVEQKDGADGKSTWEYDFKEPSEAGDWTPMATAKWYPVPKGNAMVLEQGDVLWKGRLAGDFVLEVEFAASPTGTRNFNVMFHASGLGNPREMRCYLAEVGAENSVLDFIPNPQLQQQVRNAGTDHIFRLNATRGFQGFFKVLEGKKAISLTGKGKYRVKIERVKTLITVTVGNSVVVRGQDDEHNEGDLAVGFSGSQGQIGRIKIVGTLEPAWLASQQGK